MKLTMTRTLIAAAGASALLAAGTGVAQAQGAFSVSANGVASMGTLAALPQTSQVALSVENLPAGVGLYAFHCLVPPPGGDPTPTRCDASDGSLVYIQAAGEQSVEEPITANAQFKGVNPNPYSGDTGTTDVNCRTDMCAIYTLGAGQASTDPAYVNVFFTQFAAAGPQEADKVRAVIRGKVIKGEWQPKVRYSKASAFEVTLRSGLTPSLSSDACEVTKSGKIRALKKSGTCTVTVTSSGDNDYAPVERQIVFRLVK